MSSLVLEPALSAEAILNAGIKKIRLPVYKMCLLGILAGFHVCIGGQSAVSVMSSSGYPTPMTTKWFGGVVFSTGLVMIVIGGAELFTGNCLILVAVLAKRVFWYEMLKDWCVVYFSNFFGVIVLGVVVYGGGINGYHNHPNAVGTLLCHISEAKADLTAWEMFLRGIGANFLVCMAVLLAVSSKTTEGKVLGCILPIACFFVVGFEHSIANMYFFTMATYLNCSVKNHGYYWLNLLLCSLGNIVGAGALALFLWLASVHGTAGEVPAVPVDPASPHFFHHSVDPSTNGTAMVPVPDPMCASMRKHDSPFAHSFGPY